MSAIAAHLATVRHALAAEKARLRKAVAIDETCFLPAALEVVERPVSPTVRLTAQLMLGAMLFLLLWLTFGRIDIVASAPGKLIPAGNVKLVQPAVPGVVRRILVREGQRVRRGQPLVLLDPTEVNADAAQARRALEEAAFGAARARAILSALDGDGFRFVAPAGSDPSAAPHHSALAAAQLARIRADSMIQADDARAASAAVAEARQQAAKLAETLPLLDEQISANETLLAKGYVSKLKVIEMRRQRMAAARDRTIALQTAARAAAQSSAAGGGIARSAAEARAAVLADLVKAEAEARLRREELVKAARRSGLQTLTAPVDGTVTGLALHTEGGVVEAAKPIMTIVPGAGGLIVEARVLSRDVGFVRPGQPVQVKLDAFPFTRYGSVPGRVLTLAADATPDERLGQLFAVRVALDRATMDRGDAVVPLTAGMAATVDIRTGRRSILSYLVSPIEQAGAEAARER